MNPDYRPMPDEIRENLIRFARETWRNDGAEGETVHRLCDELEHLVAYRDGWKRAAESQNKQWSAKCGELTEMRVRAEAAERERVDALNTSNNWREAIESCCFGAIPSPRAAKSTIEELKTKLDEATKRARRSESDAAESRAWHQTAIELKKRLVAAEDELMRMKGPALAYVSNGEAGDGQSVCSSCGEERDQPHTWEECAKRLAEMHEKADAAYWDAVHQRDAAIEESRAQRGRKDG